MSETATRRATYADLEAVPQHLVAEIIGGRLHTHPRPAPRHAHAHSILAGDLTGPFGRGRGGPGGWWILFEPEIHLGEHVLVPDIAGWRRERMPALPDGAWFELAPDWVCEVLSPGTARLDRTGKMPLYARFGVGHLWLVDPAIRVLECYRLHDRSWLLLGAFENDARVEAEPFDAVALDLAGLWVD